MPATAGPGQASRAVACRRSPAAHLAPHRPCLYCHRYRGPEWSYFRGGLSTIDRDYGIFNKIQHDIGTHVVHHLFPQVCGGRGATWQGDCSTPACAGGGWGCHSLLVRQFRLGLLPVLGHPPLRPLSF